jgi:hypothetical protein
LFANNRERGVQMNNYSLSFRISEEEYEKKFTLIKVEHKFIYEDGRKTDRYNAYTLTFLTEDGDVLKVHIDKISVAECKKMQDYYIVFDEERTRPYVYRGYVNYSVWAKEIRKVSEKNDNKL